MNAEQAAELTSILKPRLSIPQHYAFTGGPIGDRLFTQSDKDPAVYVDASQRLAPDVAVRILTPGERLAITE